MEETRKELNQRNSSSRSGIDEGFVVSAVPFLHRELPNSSQLDKHIAPANIFNASVRHADRSR
jgi:hypothetical protein